MTTRSPSPWPEHTDYFERTVRVKMALRLNGLYPGGLDVRKSVTPFPVQRAGE